MFKKKILVLMSSLMLVSSFGIQIFAEAPDAQDTNLSYDVTEGYEWLVPSKIEFTSTSFENVSATGNDGQVKITKNVIKEGKKLVISVDDSNDFKLSESTGHELSYSVFAGGSDTALIAGDEVLSLNAGESCDNAQVDITATLTKDTNEIAGDYQDTLTFVASVQDGSGKQEDNPPTKGLKITARTTVPNVSATLIEGSEETTLKNAYKQDYANFNNEEVDNAKLIKVTTDAVNINDGQKLIEIDTSDVVEENQPILIYNNNNKLVKQTTSPSNGLVELIYDAGWNYTIYGAQVCTLDYEAVKMSDAYINGAELVIKHYANDTPTENGSYVYYSVFGDPAVNLKSDMYNKVVLFDKNNIYSGEYIIMDWSVPAATSEKTANTSVVLFDDNGNEMVASAEGGIYGDLYNNEYEMLASEYEDGDVTEYIKNIFENKINCEQDDYNILEETFGDYSAYLIDMYELYISTKNDYNDDLVMPMEEMYIDGYEDSDMFTVIYNNDYIYVIPFAYETVIPDYVVPYFNNISSVIMIIQVMSNY